MSDLQTRYAELQAAGRLPLYGYDHAIVDAAKATNILIRLGYLPASGRYLSMPDLDGPSHGPTFDAEAARKAFERAEPEIARKLQGTWVRSRSGDGWHVFIESYKPLPTGKLYANGRHIGELLGDGSHTIDPGELEIPCLTPSEIERLLSFWTVQGKDAGGERWSDRANKGERWARGYTRLNVTRQQLRIFLQNDCGKVGIALDAPFDQRGLFNRSDAAGNLMQTLMLFAHKLPCGWDAPFTTKCAYVMAYWMAADSYGKVGEKDYNPEKDGYSLIAQIVHEDKLLSGRKWSRLWCWRRAVSGGGRWRAPGEELGVCVWIVYR